MGKRCNATLILILASVFLIHAQATFAQDEYKPYLHKAEVPEHPKIKLYGTYSTELFPGAATYSYRIDVPPGTNGLQPEIVITYNNQNARQRPGILGAGWSIIASYIFRDINSTAANTSDDEFKLVLNGALHNLVYNESEGFYRTESDSYMRIENLSTDSNEHGVYWLLTEKDGTKHRFGYTGSSELASNTGKDYSVKWSVDKVEDTYGNSISYTYAEDPFQTDWGAVYVTNITYNNDNSRKINFFYEITDKPDIRLVYEQGNALRESRQLHIECNFREQRQPFGLTGCQCPLWRQYSADYNIVHKCNKCFIPVRD